MPAPEPLPAPPSREEFANLIRVALRQAGESAELHYHEEEFQLRVEGNELRYGNLSNLFGEYTRADEEQRARLVRNYVRSWFARLKDVPEDFEDCQPDLLPSIRPRSYIELNLLQLRLQGALDPTWPYLPYAEHLALSLVYDLPESLVQIQQRHLDAWGVDFTQALERALANLMAISNHEFDEVSPGLWRSPWEDNLDVSRIVLPPLLLAHSIEGDPVVMVPNRDTLLLTGADDEAGLARMAELAEEAFNQPRSISGIALRFAGDHWDPFFPEPEHPAYNTFRILYLRSRAGDYSSQKELLDQRHEETGEDVFVAGYSAFEEQASGNVLSYCVWSEGIESLLPETDRIFFVRAAGEESEVVAMARWERVVELAGGLLEREEMYPPRVRVSDFPSQEQLALLDERGA